MSTLYQSSKDVPTEVLSARLNQLSDVVSSNRERIDAEFTMRIPAEADRDADLVMPEAADRLEALQAECERLVEALEPFAACAGELDGYPADGVEPSDDNEWASFRLLVSDYRRARAALAAYRKGGEQT